MAPMVSVVRITPGPMTLGIAVGMIDASLDVTSFWFRDMGFPA